MGSGGREEKDKERGGRKEGRKEGINSTHNFVSLVSSSTMADASSSRNCMHMARRLSA